MALVHLIMYELAGIRMPDEIVKLESAIKELGESYALAKATWIVETELSNQMISERLAPRLRPKDRIFVSRIYRDWVAANLPPEEVDWLSARNFASPSDDRGIAPQFRR
jgi:hypothetical protein